MDINEYQEKATSTDVYDVKRGEAHVTDIAFINKVLGLSGESGEFADKIKKIHRNQDGDLKPGDKEELIKELGDVMWYIALISHYLGFNMSEVAKVNLDKLADRKKRNVLKAEGDNR